MSTATVEQPINTEVRVYKPSDSLMALANNIKAVAKFDPGLLPIFEQATKIAAVNQLLGAPEMGVILDKLENNPAGFLTDMKGDQKYPIKERNQAVTQALSLGAQLVNKEFTIIKGNAFLGKNFYQRMLDTLGHENTFTEACRYRMLWWDTESGDIINNGNMASCMMTIRYKMVDKDTKKEVEREPFSRKFFIRTNSTDTPDLWIGKFERRAWQKLLRYLAGVDFGDDGDEGGAGAAPTQAVAPPVGTMNLSKEVVKPTQAAPAPTAEEADYTPVPAAPKEKAYADMNQKERAEYTAKHNAAQAAAQTAPAQAAQAAKADVKLGNATIPAMPAPVMPAGTPPAGPSVASQPVAPPAQPAPVAPPAGPAKPELF